MRVAIITPIYPPVMGGASIDYSTLVFNLKNKIDIQKIFIITTIYKNTKPISTSKKICILRCLKGTSEIPLLNSFLLFFLIIILKIDILHVHSSFSPKFLSKFYRLIRNINIPLICDIRDRESISNAFFSDCVFTVSKEILTIVKSIHLKKLAWIIPPLISIKKFQFKYLKFIKKKYSLDSPYICYVGDITENKGALKLIRAFNHFIEKKTNYELIMVGRKLVKSFDKMINQKRFRYLGELSHIHTLAIIRCSELLILPSQSEGIPRVCLEAMALKTKVVLPPIPIFKKYCQKNVIENFTQEGISNKIFEVLDDQDYECKYPLKRHESKKVAEQVYLAYKEILNSKIIFRA